MSRGCLCGFLKTVSWKFTVKCNGIMLSTDSWFNICFNSSKLGCWAVQSRLWTGIQVAVANQYTDRCSYKDSSGHCSPPLTATGHIFAAVYLLPGHVVLQCHRVSLYIQATNAFISSYCVTSCILQKLGGTTTWSANNKSGLVNCAQGCSSL